MIEQRQADKTQDKNQPFEYLAFDPEFDPTAALSPNVVYLDEAVEEALQLEVVDEYENFSALLQASYLTQEQLENARQGMPAMDRAYLVARLN